MIMNKKIFKKLSKKGQTEVLNLENRLSKVREEITKIDKQLNAQINKEVDERRLKWKIKM